MIPLLAALPLSFAFATALLLPLHRKNLAKYLFLTGAFVPWGVFLLGGEGSEIVGGWTRMGGIEVAVGVYSRWFILAELLLFSIAALYSVVYFRGKVKPFVLLLLIHTGLLGAFISRDLFNYYIYMEVVSVSTFSLVAFPGSSEAKKAAYKYLMLSMISSYFFVFAVGLLYLKTGYLNLYLMSQVVTQSKEVAAAIAIAFTSLLLKAGIFPLHSWLPDANSAAPTPVVILSGITVNVPLYGMLLLSTYLPLSVQFKAALTSIAFISMFAGVGMALLQRDAKRLLAYSTVSQMGYALIGIGTGNPLGAVYYSFAHSIIKGGLFLSVGSLSDARGSRRLDALSYRGDVLIAVSVIALSLAIGGVSPFVSALGKAEILQGLTWGRWLVYLAGVGTLAAFAKLNYWLSRGVGVRVGGVYRLLSIIPTLLVMGFGLYLYRAFQPFDAVTVGAGILTFALLRLSGLTDRGIGFELPVGRDVSINAALYALFLLLLLHVL